METRELGKITSVEFGVIDQYPFLFGLSLSMGGNSWGVCDHFVYNIKYQKQECEKIMDKIFKLLNDAKVNNISELIEKPIEVTFEGGTIKSFRILTEVI